MTQGKRRAVEAAPRRKCTVSWLTGELRIYLKGFLKRGIRPETRKNSQKCARGKHEVLALTALGLTMMPRLRAFTGCEGSLEDELASRPSPQPSPRKLALASLQLGVAASASGCGWRGSPAVRVERTSLLPGGEGQDEGSDASSFRLPLNPPLACAAGPAALCGNWSDRPVGARHVADGDPGFRKPLAARGRSFGACGNAAGAPHRQSGLRSRGRPAQKPAPGRGADRGRA